MTATQATTTELLMALQVKLYRPGSHQDLAVALEQASFSRNSSTCFSPNSSMNVGAEKLISKGLFFQS